MEGLKQNQQNGQNDAKLPGNGVIPINSPNVVANGPGVNSTLMQPQNTGHMGQRQFVGQPIYQHQNQSAAILQQQHPSGQQIPAPQLMQQVQYQQQSPQQYIQMQNLQPEIQGLYRTNVLPDQQIQSGLPPAHQVYMNGQMPIGMQQPQINQMYHPQQHMAQYQVIGPHGGNQPYHHQVGPLQGYQPQISVQQQQSRGAPQFIPQAPQTQAQQIPGQLENPTQNGIIPEYLNVPVSTMATSSQSSINMQPQQQYLNNSNQEQAANVCGVRKSAVGNGNPLQDTPQSSIQKMVNSKDVVDLQFFLNNEKLEHQFLMLQYKVSQCTNLAHQNGGSNCMFYHSGMDKRRQLFADTKSPQSSLETTVKNDIDKQSHMAYSHILCCIKMQNQGLCVLDEQCKNAHSETEIQYHPAVFKTQACRDMSHIQIRIFSQNNLPMNQFSQEQLETYSMCPHYHDEIIDRRNQDLVACYLPKQEVLSATNPGDQKQLMTQFQTLMNQVSNSSSAGQQTQEQAELMQSMMTMFSKLQMGGDCQGQEQPQAMRKNWSYDSLSDNKNMTGQNLENYLKGNQNTHVVTPLIGHAEPSSSLIQFQQISDTLSDRVGAKPGSNAGSRTGSSRSKLSSRSHLSHHSNSANLSSRTHEVSHQLLTLQGIGQSQLSGAALMSDAHSHYSHHSMMSDHGIDNHFTMPREQNPPKNYGKIGGICDQEGYRNSSSTSLDISGLAHQEDYGHQYFQIQTQQNNFHIEPNHFDHHSQASSQSMNKRGKKRKSMSSGKHLPITGDQLHEVKMTKNQKKKALNKQFPQGKNNKKFLPMGLPFNNQYGDGLQKNEIQHLNDNQVNNLQNPMQAASFQNYHEQNQMNPQTITKSPKIQGQTMNQNKQATNKREKIFIDIYSSYLHVNKNSPQRPTEKLNDDYNELTSREKSLLLDEMITQGFTPEGEGERELTPMRRGPTNPNASRNAQHKSFGNTFGQGESNMLNNPDLDDPHKKVGTSQIIKYLDLSKFKIEKCKNLTNGRQHNHKHCRYYHTIKDRRRILDYSFIQHIAAQTNPNFKESIIQRLQQKVHTPDLCDYQETENCINADNCQSSHNRVESVYHPEKYKSKYCTKYPKNLNKCEYGDYCSFAHNTKELKTRLIHQMKKDADFYMFYFKTEWCPFNKEHNKAQCVYAHNWQDFRRKPNIFSYDCKNICSNWKPGTFIAKYHEGCPNQASCQSCHGWKEQEYHPLFYKTKPCQEEQRDTVIGGTTYQKCSRAIECPYYHSLACKRETGDMAKQQRDRPDFLYDKILEMSMNLSNINQLQELILIKVAEQFCTAKKEKTFYLENVITEQHKQNLVNKGVFRDITLHCMVTRKVLSEQLFHNQYKEHSTKFYEKNQTNEKHKKDKRISSRQNLHDQGWKPSQSFLPTDMKASETGVVRNITTVINPEPSIVAAAGPQYYSNGQDQYPMASQSPSGNYSMVTFNADGVKPSAHNVPESVLPASGHHSVSSLQQMRSDSKASNFSHFSSSRQSLGSENTSNKGILGQNEIHQQTDANFSDVQQPFQNFQNQNAPTVGKGPQEVKNEMDFDTQSKMSLFQQYFNMKFQNGQNFRFKKFNSEKFDPNSIQQMDLVDKNMDNLVEEITQEERLQSELNASNISQGGCEWINNDINQNRNSSPNSNASHDVKGTVQEPIKVFDRQNSYVAAGAQQQIFDIFQQPLNQIQENSGEMNQNFAGNRLQDASEIHQSQQVNAAGPQPSNQQWNNFLENVSYERDQRRNSTTSFDSHQRPGMIQTKQLQPHAHQGLIATQNWSPTKVGEPANVMPLQNIQFYSREKLLKQSSKLSTENAAIGHPTGSNEQTSQNQQYVPSMNQNNLQSAAFNYSQPTQDDPFFYDDNTVNKNQ